MKANTLFILFYFPPFKRVGGRRWAKYLKYLNKLDIEFNVLAGNYDSTSPWDKDIAPFQSKISRIPITINYPYFKKTLPTTNFQKVKWQLSKNYSNYKANSFKGNYWDDSNGYENVFLKKAIDLIGKYKIKQIVLSVGPYRISSILISLKNKFPEIKIVIDFRDYLEDGFSQLNKTQIRYEQEFQINVLKNVDKVIVVNNEMKNYFIEKLFMKKVYVLPHCYDEDDFKSLTIENRKKENDVVRFVYGGALYSDMENHLNDFIQFLNKLYNQGISVEVNFYSAQEGYKKIVEASLVKINIHNYVPLEEYMDIVNNSDIILFFRPDWSPNAMSSKFFEMVRFKKTILYFGPQSDVSDFINENRLGLHYSKNWTADKIKCILSDIKKDVLLNKSYNIEQHSFEKSTLDLISILNE